MNYKLITSFALNVSFLGYAAADRELSLLNAFHRQPSEVESLLKQGANVHETNEYGATPLHLACLAGNLAVARLLLAAGADANARTETLQTPLHSACCAIEALQKPTHPTCCDSDEVSIRGHIAEALLQAGADMRATNMLERTPLDTACLNGLLDTVKVLIEEGDYISREQLMLACKNGHTELVKYLVEVQKMPIGNEELSAATRTIWNTESNKERRQKTADYLKTEMTKNQDEESKHAQHLDVWRFEERLREACINGNDSEVKRLIQLKQNREKWDWGLHRQELHKDCLTDACKGNKLNVVKALIGLGVSVNYDSGYAPLDIACARGYTDIVNVLHKAGAHAATQ